MIQTLKILWNKSNKKIKYQFLFLTIAVIFSSFAEVISLSSVIPFITALLNPENILNSRFIKFFPLDLSGFSTNSLILYSTLFLVFFSFLASLLKIFVLGTIRLWANNFGTNMATEIYEKILYQPYEEHLKIDSSHYISVVTADTNDFINQLIVPLLNMVASSFIAISILMTLILINGWYSIFIFLIIFIFYLIALKLSGKSLKRLGFRKVFLRETVLKNIQEGMSSIKEIILSNNYSFHVNIFRNLDRSLRFIQAKMYIFAIVPKSIVDPAGISIIALTGFFIAKYGDIANALPFLVALSLGAQKLIPQVQLIYQSWSAIRGSQGILEKITKLLNKKIPDVNKLRNNRYLQLNKCIEFKDIYFRYGKNLPLVLSGLNLKINKGDKIGIIGSTGSGKSTFIDLFMGFLNPIDGEIIVDNKILNKKNNIDLLTAWRLSIAYVPQMIFLTNATIAENIAFGIPKNKIDLNRVKVAAKQAQISEFIEGKEDSYEAKVGERGIKLSGGQRQRIGVARALYKKTNILVLDEATSALDEKTEEKFVKALGNLSLDKDLTIIVIAHRYSTLSHCNRIIELKNGRVKKEFKFEELKKRGKI